MSKSVLILGANGRLGQVLCSAFLAAGWQVSGQIRREPPEDAPTGIAWIRAPIDQPVELATAAGAADVVVHAANPPYTQWQREVVPLAMGAVETARALNALLMFPGNVYNFGASMPQTLLESTPQRPTARKGRIRAEVENKLREAARAGLRTVTIRAGDFFGGPGRGSWFDLVIAKSLAAGRVVYPGRTDIIHAWAYLPDLARTFVLVAERRAGLPPFGVFHFPGHSPTGEEFLACIDRSARRLGLLRGSAHLRRGAFPWGLLRVGGLVVPMWRELAEMRYLWDVPHRLSGEHLARLMGAISDTPLDQAMDETLRALFPATN